MRPTQPLKGPSQRQLRVGEQGVVALLVLVFSLYDRRHAVAEVCDKVAGEGWARTNGPVFTLPFGGLHLLEAPLIALLLASSITVALLVQFRRTKRTSALFFGILCAVTGVGMFGIGLWGIEEPTIQLAAIHEGCWTTSPTGGIEGPAVIFVVSALCFWAWYNNQEKGVAS
ncbi:MAG: hypothetical protein CTY25_13955 [Methylobacterium sp.]|nr:MAG: hypothetical protein CTY25_13955 [Methylobacterium sp.]